MLSLVNDLNDKIMNKIFLWSIVTCLLSLFVACSSDPVFPDPGFDMLSDKNFTVRRDTADKFTLKLNVKAPAGIDVIQILNGRTFEVMEELTEYRGQKEFVFQHSLSFEGIDKGCDSVLIYNVRIVTNDSRAYNSSFKINLKKLSMPEVALASSNIIGTCAPVVGIRGIVETGVYKIRSIKIYVEGQERYSVPGEELKDLSEYKLNANVSYDFQVGREYPVEIEVYDERGEVHREPLTVKGIKMKKVSGIEVAYRGNSKYAKYNFVYDEKDRINKIIYTQDPLSSYTINLAYDQEGRVVSVEYYFHEDPTFIARAYMDFTYLNGRVEQATHWRLADFADPESKGNYAIIQNFKYRPDGTYQAFDIGITTYEDIQYVDGFFPGEKIFAEGWKQSPEYMSLGIRRMKTGFVPVLNPCYLNGMPPIWRARWFGDKLMDLCWYKYVYTGEQAGPGNSESGVSWPEYTYTCSEDGQLEMFVYKEYPAEYYWYKCKYIYFEEGE